MYVPVCTVRIEALEVCVGVCACVCACVLLMASAVVDEGLCLNIPLGVLSGQHKHCLHNEGLERPPQLTHTHISAHTSPDPAVPTTTAPP